ncbi:MAG TPA: DUF1573 domain-containing protein [Opitutaceae bacterium]|jgi:hypothetical protein|nr:DUF1573 domain-containing protein [Opitutaceae bacterium]
MCLKTRPIALFALSLFFLAKLDASTLTWAKDKISTEVIEGEQPEVKATFPFKNTGDHPVTILGAHPSCGCTTAALTKKTYAPGESGEIAVVFHTAGRIGMQEKFITVTTNEPNQTPTRLLLEVNIKEYLSIEPRLLKWKQGDKPSEQQVALSCLPLHPITEVIAKCEPTGTFETRIEVVEKGLKYNLYVKPISTAERQNAVLKVTAKFDNKTERQTESYLYVNPPGMNQMDDD